MAFQHLAEVELKSNNKIRGKVLGTVKNLSGTPICLVQAGDILYASRETLWRVTSCDHSKDFYFHVERGLSAWACVKGCGFHLNFDPVKFPEGIALVESSKIGRVVEYVTSKF